MACPADIVGSRPSSRRVVVPGPPWRSSQALLGGLLGTSRNGMSRSTVRSRGIPRTRSLITLRAISVVPPAMHEVWRIRKSIPAWLRHRVVVAPRNRSRPGELERDRLLSNGVDTAHQSGERGRLVGHLAAADPDPTRSCQRRLYQGESVGLADQLARHRVVGPPGRGGDWRMRPPAREEPSSLARAPWVGWSAARWRNSSRRTSTGSQRSSPRRSRRSDRCPGSSRPS